LEGLRDAARVAGHEPPELDGDLRCVALWGNVRNAHRIASHRITLRDFDGDGGGGVCTGFDLAIRVDPTQGGGAYRDLGDFFALRSSRIEWPAI
jgi:hypothetical protein